MFSFLPKAVQITFANNYSFIIKICFSVFCGEVLPSERTKTFNIFYLIKSPRFPLESEAFLVQGCSGNITVICDVQAENDSGKKFGNSLATAALTRCKSL